MCGSDQRLHVEALEGQLDDKLLRLAEQLEQEIVELDGREAELHRREEDLERALNEVQQRQSQTSAHRRRIARELREWRAEKKEQGGEQTKRAQLLQQAIAERDQLRSELAALSHDSVSDQLRTQEEITERAMQEAERLMVEVEQLRDEVREAELRAGEPADDGAREEVAQLQDRVKDLEHQLDNTSSSESADLQRRLELAVEEVRELKTENATLADRAEASEAKLANSGDGFDWETQKKRMLSQLDDSDCSDDDRLRIEDVIRKTEDTVKSRDREIETLRAQLADVNSDGSAAIDEVLDQDEVVRVEREKLRVLQSEWEEKLRSSEIEISVERAKLARERVDIEEQLNQMHERMEQLAAAGGPPAGGGESAPSKSRWLARLGLADDSD